MHVFSVVLVFSMLNLGRILISDLVVANLLMYSLPAVILLYLAVPFFTLKVFWIIYIYIYIYIQDIRKNFEFEKGSRDRNKK